MMIGMVKDGTALIGLDSWLEAYRDKLKWRENFFQKRLSDLSQAFGSLEEAGLGHKYFGFNKGFHKGKPGVWYREWAPEALSLAVIGDFNQWERFRHPMTKDEFGVWSIFLPDDVTKYKMDSGMKVKVHVVSKKHSLDRIPAYILRVEQDKDTLDFFGVYVDTGSRFQWQYPPPHSPESLRIYEAHVGMAQEKFGVGNYQEFRELVLPRIKSQGYNAIQLMAVAQHPYYGSFGYQVSNFFAVSHFMGTADDLRQLIDEAHGLGILVFMDLVHSHTVKNLNDGLNEFDGSGYQYFHEGIRGDHPGWDTKLFNYGKMEVLRFLLSNVRYWLQEFKFDGFRFDGVTSMIYKNHGLNMKFDHYDRYFDENVDEDAIVYLKLANELVHRLKPNSTTIAEEVSGMPGLARPITDGGLGFDYRLAMGIPDYWIKLLKHFPDEEWPIEEIFGMLTNRRTHEKHVAYAESHDQALVGDKTIAFWLMDKDMYEHMTLEWENANISRGIALHNMIRLLTFSAGGDAWLNFMGNEFGHPEWIDFPREGNNFSFHYARRQWSLVENKLLRYQHLNNFDKAMNQLDEKYKLLKDPLLEHIWHHQDGKILVYRRGPLVFIFNFHPNKSEEGLRIGVPDQSDYRVVLSTDEKGFGGFGRVLKGFVYPLDSKPYHHRFQSVLMYLPARTAQILAPVTKMK